MKSLKEHIKEELNQKFQRATKTDTAYTGTINGKTWVVPHAFHGSHDVLHGTKTTPIRHAIVVSPTHVQHNNPTLKPEELARVHKHIKDTHGGQQGQAPKFDSFGKLEEEYDYPDPSPKKPAKGTPEYQAERDKYRHAALLASRKAATLAFAKRKHIIKETAWHVTDHLGNKHEVQAKDKTEAMKKTVSVGGIHKDGIPMTQWNKVKVEPKKLDESFMGIYTRNENANRHTANIVHLAKHFGTAADHAQAKFYADELKKHGHNIHHEAQYKLHDKLWPLAQAAHHMKEETTVASAQLSRKERNKKFGDVLRAMPAGKSQGPVMAAHPSHLKKEEVEQLNELSDSAKKFVHHREEHWKHAKLNRHAQDRTAAKFHSNEMQKHFHAMTPSEKYRAHTGSWVSNPSKRLGGGSAKEDKEYVHEGEQTMSTTKQTVKAVLAEMMTRKHFQMVADTIKSHPDAAKRAELAAHHAGIFKKDNPRFDHKRFYAAANAGEPK